MKQNKITPAIQARIAEIAKDLPPMALYQHGKPVYKWVIVPGTHPQLVSNALKNGTPLNPKGSYRIEELQYENHTLNMINGVQKEGPVFIEDYRQAIETQLEHFKVKTLRQMKWYRRWWSILKSLISKHEK